MIITQLSNEQLLKKAQSFHNNGTIVQLDTYSYLKIGNEYIHELYELLPTTPTLQKPDYFSSTESIGAHITVTYNEENTLLHFDDIGAKHSFSIINLSHVVFGSKEYYVLMVESPSLDKTRAKYDLPKKPHYKGTYLDFHITIAVNSSIQN